MTGKTKDAVIRDCEKVGEYWGTLNPGHPSEGYLPVYKDSAGRVFVLSTNDYASYRRVYLRPNNPKIQALKKEVDEQ